MKNGKTLAVIYALSFVFVLIGSTMAYFTMTSGSTQSAAGASSSNVGISLLAEPLYNEKKLIPLNDSDVMTAYDSNCVDINNYGACHAYTITIENAGNALTYDGYVNFELTNITNLNYMVLDENDDASEEDDLAQTITLELEKKELDRANNKNNLIDLLKDNNIDYLDIDQFAFEQLEENYDEAVFKNNIETLKDLKIDLDILTDNPTLFYDNELKDKINLLMENGKETLDIYFNAKVLVKYNYDELKEAINKIKENGLDPKDVPLMAY